MVIIDSFKKYSLILLPVIYIFLINRPILDIPTYITSLQNIPQCFLIQDDLVFPLIVFCTWYLESIWRLVALIFDEKNFC